MATPNEQERTAEFERSVGGPDRAFRLLRLYERARQGASGNASTLRRQPTAEERLRSLARSEGYSQEQVTALLSLQR